MADATKSEQQGTTGADIWSQSQPATSEELEARAHRPRTVAPSGPPAAHDPDGSPRRDGDPSRSDRR